MSMNTDWCLSQLPLNFGYDLTNLPRQRAAIGVAEHHPTRPRLQRRAQLVERELDAAVPAHTVDLRTALAAGAKGKRYCLPHSRVMIHQPLGGFQGQASDIDIHAREILKIRDQLNKILSDHTGQPIEKIGEDTERDNFMSSAEAAAYGLIDEVLNTRG